MERLHAVDYAVVAVYFIVIGGMGLWIARGQKTTSK